MGAVWARARSGLRRSLASSLALILMVGIASAAVLSSAAAARRTDTAYARFRVATNGFDAMTIGCADDEGPWPEIDPANASLPMVSRSADLYYVMGYPTTEGGEVLFRDEPNVEGGVTGMKTQADAKKLGMKVLAGRLADPTDPNEVTVGYRNPQDPRIKVGMTILMHPLDPDADLSVIYSGEGLPPEIFAEPIPLKVVGITLTSGPGNEVRGDAQDIIGTPAFHQKYGAEQLDCGGQLYWLQRGQEDAPAFLAAVQEADPNALVLSGRDEATFVNRATHLQAVTMWLFAAFVAVAGLIIFGQALARQTSVEATDNPILRAIGMTRGQLFGVAMLRSLVLGLLASSLASVMTFAVSGSLVTGIARLVEPDPGPFIDPAIMVGGFLFIVVAVMLISVLPAWRAARTRGDSLGAAIVEEGRRPSAIAAAASRAGVPAPTSTGMKLALEPGRGRTAVPVRSAIIGLVLAIIAVVGSLTFGSSFQHLLDTPRLMGVTFDTALGNPFAPPMRDTVRPLMATDPGLENVAGGNFANQVSVQSPGNPEVQVNLWGLEPIRGTQHPPTTEGVWPAAEGEIALGAKTMRQVGSSIGQTVTVTAGGTTAELRVVGQAVFPDFGFGPGLGEGAGTTFTQLLEFFPDADENLYAADIAPGADFADVKARVDPVIEEFGAGPLQFGDQNSDGNGSLSEATKVRSLPTVLSGVVALMAIAMLAHTLVSSIRRRRRDLAIVKTLGFTRGQVSTAVAWQASTLVIVSLLIGVPIGIAIGRWAWNLFADTLGVVPEAVVPLRSVALMIPIALIVANLIALLPGRAAGRTKPSIALRAE